MKILVVDDETLLVKGMKFNLENEGYEAVSYTHLDVYKRQTILSTSELLLLL